MQLLVRPRKPSLLASKKDKETDCASKTKHNKQYYSQLQWQRSSTEAEFFL